MNPRAKELVSELHKFRAEMASDATRYQTHQSALTGELLLLLAEEQEAFAVRMERRTVALVRLTWGLVVLTIGLLLFTAYLTYDVYLHRQRDQAAQPHAAQQYELHHIHAAQHHDSDHAA